MPLVDRKTYYAAMHINEEARKIILPSLLIFAGLAILVPMASGQQWDYNPTNPDFDSIYTGVPSLRPSNENVANSYLLEFCDDDSGGGATEGHRDVAGSNSSGDAAACAQEGNPEGGQASQSAPGNRPGEASKNQPSAKRLRVSKPDFNRDFYYGDKLEFALDVGWLPINVPFPFDIFLGDTYELYPLRYTLVPIIGSLRWHFSDIKGPLILRGNWDATFSLSVTAIPRGPETRYFSYDMGVRRNFVPRNWRVTPYWDVRAGLGLINAKGPLGVYYAQGQDFTFTLNMGSGVRYNFNPRYAITAGLNWMHISNANLSAPRYSNYGINVYGPMFGIDIQLRRHQRHSEQ
jgi:hypothetical protein